MYLSRKHEEKSPLASYLMLSIGLHAFLLILFLWVVPDIEIYQRKITVTMNLGSAVPTAPTPPVPNEVPIPPKPTPAPPQKKEVQKPVTPKKPVESKPVEKKVAPPKPVPTPSPTPTKTEPVSPPEPSVAETPKVAEQKLETPPAPTPTPVQEKITPVETPAPPKEEEILANELENLLAQKQDNKTLHADFLDNASWTGSPRKTIIFPKIAERIPAEYKARGYGYSVTASITFSPQGWVSAVELLKSSGDPIIDNVFRNELRKIRIEESDKNTYDTVIKTFTISVK